MQYSTTTDAHDSYQQPGKRVKLEQSAIPFYPSFDTSTLNLALSGNMHQSQIQGLNPHSLQRTSESVSPVTVATPLSQPSSPLRVSVVSDSIYEESLDTLAHDQRKGQAPLNHHHRNTPQPQISLQMEATLPNSYYAGFPTDFSKLSHHQQYLSPFTPTYQSLSHNRTIPHHSHTVEDEPPALSPAHSYQSPGRPSVYDADIRPPMTPVGSPRPSDGDRISSTRTPITREDTYVYIYDDWMDEGLQFPFIDIQHPVPKLTRTVSDAEEDELFRSSSIEVPMLQQPRQRQNNAVSGGIPGTLATFYQKAQDDHAMEARHTTPNQLNVSRGDSPFRANSPFHPMRTPQTAVSAPTRHSNFHPYMTIQARREHQKELDTKSMNEHMVAEISSTPKTISPKDAVLDYPEPTDEASKMSLFAHEHSHPASLRSYNSQEITNDIDDQSYGFGASRRGSEAESLNSVGAFSYHQHSPQMPILPSNFPHHSHSLESSPITAPVMIGDHRYSKSSSPITKPEGSKADTGAYTCTVPGCQQRFTTSLKLQKHKHQNHRQSTPIGLAGMTSTLRGNLSSRHQGPHRCTMINPQNGKPCNTVFSRPYDLTRHEDTIHNTTREKVRCEICNDEKTFSRQDALTRHKKVKHGIDK
ncbi:hypothetical protein EV426DRAFT_705757 [Tirmania nivea]|nr:hypothetical protein EV426DRAFT_705757 [Tirmania nivea]